jgi:alpha-D-ribose 1-methylphosphonate 5-triphosphate synthase subunit PhnI
VRNKYKAVAELRTKNNRTVVLRFANLTFKEAQAFQVVFDKFNHTHSDADLVFHGWEKVEPPAPVEHNPHTLTPRVVDLLHRQSQYLKQEDRDAIALRLAALNTEGE